MALDMTAEERELGKKNFREVTEGLTRRGFMKSMAAGAAVAPVAAGAYFGYEALKGKPVKAALIGAGDEGGVLVGEHPPEFLEFAAVCDIRPYNQERIFEGQGKTHIRKGFENIEPYGKQAREKVKLFKSDYRKELIPWLIENKDVEAVVIALPLHLHAPAAIDVMRAGQQRGKPIHVLCEKLMARTITQCKEMIRTARETGSILSIGHQRHYSLLYAHALEVMNSGVLGDVRHIRALWHRNNSWPYEPKPGEVDYAKLGLRAPHYRDGWFPPILQEDYDALKDEDLAKYGFDSIDQLVRWRLYNKTGGGLMAELGSHQLDACSIFLGKVKPLSVQGVGVKSFYEPGENDRSCDDHVFCTFEFPGPNHPKGPNKGNDANDIVVVTYSSINTNGFENYGECVMGTRGTMIVEAEQSVMLYAEPEPGKRSAPRSTNVTVSTVGAEKAALEASASYAAPVAAAGTTAAAVAGPVSRGYTEEMQDFAYCIRMWDPKVGYEKDSNGQFRQRLPRCHGEVAMADAILALSANIAMDVRKRIEFLPEWFQWDNDAVPDLNVKLEETFEV